MQENQLQINGIPETMLQTMYARSIESQKAKPLIYDKKAIEIVKKLDYDFSFAKKDKAMGNGVIARTIILDKLAGNFIARNPAACIVNIGCGLDTRYFRVDNGKIIWYDIDLPVTIDIRQRFISDNNRNKMIKGSILEEC
jgi:O-methyltransferase involved in polyketide biosynthesis